MSRRTAELLLDDIREAIEKIERYTGNLSLDGFMADEMTQDAVVRNLEINDIEWPKIVGLRHRIVHDYFGIDLQIIWRIINEDLLVFKAQLP